MGEMRKALKKAFCSGAYMVRGRERREREREMKNEKLKWGVKGDMLIDEDQASLNS